MKPGRSQLLTLLMVFSLLQTFGQSIRKNFLEMTAYEKNALVNAFYSLRNGPDLVNDLAVYIGDNFTIGISPICSIPYFPYES